MLYFSKTANFFRKSFLLKKCSSQQAKLKKNAGGLFPLNDRIALKKNWINVFQKLWNFWKHSHLATLTVSSVVINRKFGKFVESFFAKIIRLEQKILFFKFSKNPGFFGNIYSLQKLSVSTQIVWIVMHWNNKTVFFLYF